MTTSDGFIEAQQRVKSLKSSPSTDELLALYALYKQGSGGDVSGSRPGMLDVKGRAKYDAWAKLKGMDGDMAKKKYVDLVQQLGG